MNKALFLLLSFLGISVYAQMGIPQSVYTKLGEDLYTGIRQEVPDFQSVIPITPQFDMGNEQLGQKSGHLYVRGTGSISSFQLINNVYWVGASAKSSYASPNHFTAEDFGIHFINLHWQGALVTVSSNTLGVSKTIPINVTLPWNSTNLPGEDLGYIYDPNSQGHVHDWKLEVVNTGHITISSVPISQLKVLAGKVRAAYEAEKTMPNAPSSQRPSGSLSNTSQNQTGYYDEAAVSEAKYVAALSQEEQEAWYERKYQEALAKGTPDHVRKEQAYQRQQRDKLKYAMNPGAYYLEKSGVWNSYNSLLDQIEQNDRRKQDQLDRQWRDEQRKERLARIRQEKEEAKRDALGKQRTDYFYSLPQGELPFDGHSTPNNKLYYFFYHYTGSLRNAESIHVSNIFAIGQYPDGSWPDSKKILEGIYQASIDPRKYVNVYHNIVGYYHSETEGNSALAAFKNNLNALKLQISTVNFQGENSLVVFGGNETLRPVNQLFAKARDLFTQKKYQDALNLYQKGLKENGGTFHEGLFMNTDMEAVGYIHYTQKKFPEAKKWFEKAADNGSVYALRTLAQMNLSGIGGELDTEKAMAFLTKAADLGDLLSERELALNYFNSGHPVLAEQTMERVANNLEQPIAERNGFKLMMARAYAHGSNGFERNISSASDLYTRLIDDRVLDAEFEFAMIHLDMQTNHTAIGAFQRVINNPEQPEEKRNLCRMALADAILTGNKNIKNSYSDYDLAMAQYNKLKELGFNIEEKLGLCLLQMNRPKEAFEIHKDSPYAGLYFYEGKMVEQNFNEALKLWESYSNQGNPMADLFLATAYFVGKGVERNPEKAIAFFQGAEKQVYNDIDALGYFLSFSDLFAKRFPSFSSDWNAFELHLITEKILPTAPVEFNYMNRNPNLSEIGLHRIIQKDVAAFQAKKGFADQSGKIVIPMVYDHIPNEFGEKPVTIVKYKGKYGVIDTLGRQQIPVVYDHLTTASENLYKVSQDGIEYFVGLDNREKLVHKNSGYEFINEFGADGMASIKRKNAWGAIDKSGKEVLPPILRYERLGNFSEGMAPFQKEGNWGYLDTTGKELIAPIYIEAGRFINGRALVKQKNKQFYIDKTGKKVK
ncbi:WG repeat-containing protein [Allomuricauda taeanensis]|uniref:WG repeat-containing protein n=1 Tax=Flagellimonas taeanensis TaxID=1005926 RepID=UPI002E7B02DE|nr:WG repeat-containing protein [Allomuricauda taeanensis]MEE1963954.1 WG repeat-containing protein [Allomuricauda taeanensis]